MKIVAKLKSASKDLTKLQDILSCLEYKTCSISKNEIFIYHDSKTPSELDRDIKKAKQKAGITVPISVIYGTTTKNI